MKFRVLGWCRVQSLELSFQDSECRVKGLLLGCGVLCSRLQLLLAFIFTSYTDTDTDTDTDTE